MSKVQFNEVTSKMIKTPMNPPPTIKFTTSKV